MKKIVFLTLFVAATLLLTLTLASATGAKAPAAPVASPANAAATAVFEGPPPRHPRVHDAIEAMRNARGLLQHAEGEFHGHREKAIEHLDQAIHEAELCEHEP